jgi:hypothetical protein
MLVKISAGSAGFSGPDAASRLSALRAIATRCGIRKIRKALGVTRAAAFPICHRAFIICACRMTREIGRNNHFSFRECSESKSTAYSLAASSDDVFFSLSHASVTTSILSIISRAAVFMTSNSLLCNEADCVASGPLKS